MNHKRSNSNLPSEEFMQVVAFFAWLKMMRDQNITQGDAFEPLNELSSCVDEIQEELLE